MEVWKNDFAKLLAIQIQNERCQKHNEVLQKQMALLEVSIFGDSLRVFLIKEM
jgi:hypothetical protein